VSWQITGGPFPAPWEGRDAVGWVWELTAGDGRSERVLVEVSGTAMAVASEYLPEETAAARQTQGRSEVERLLEEGELPPRIALGTTGYLEPAPFEPENRLEEGWWVRLAGEEADLGFLSELFTQPSLRVISRAGGTYLRSDRLEPLADASDVRSQAINLLRIANGAARLERPTFRPAVVDVVTVVSEAGAAQHFIELADSAMRITDSVTVTVRDADGTVVTVATSPQPHAQEWVALASQADEVAQALRLLSQEDISWASLYHLYEIVLGDVGRALHDNGWATRAEVERFARTANSPAVLGEHARHGRQRGEPPHNPMSLDESRELVQRIVTRWLDHRCRQPTAAG
jgi:hypothetical protein